VSNYKLTTNQARRDSYVVFDLTNRRTNDEQSTVSLNSIYFQISIYTWQHTSIQIHGKWIGKQIT